MSQVNFELIALDQYISSVEIAVIKMSLSLNLSVVNRLVITVHVFRLWSCLYFP